MKDKKPKKDVKLNFDPSKHDKQIDEALHQETKQKQTSRQKQVKKAIQRDWERWKNQVKGKPRTAKDVIAATYCLQTIIGQYAATCKACGLEEWHNFTMQIIEDKIATCVATDITEKNQIVQYIPPNPTLMDSDNDAIVADQLRRDVKPVTFRTYEEFMEIPFVKSFTVKQDFVGLCLHANGVVAVFRDGVTAGVGILANGVGVDKLPSLEDFALAMEAARSATADAGSTSGAADASADAPGSADTTGPDSPTKPSSSSNPAKPTDGNGS